MLLDLPPRYMWGWGVGLSGYCGSASVQSIGIFYGNWLSQDAVRGSTGSTQASNELSLGAGGCCATVDVLRRLGMNATQWPFATAARPQAPAFLRWLAAAAAADEPAIFGVFMKTETASDFDHIVPFRGFDASGSLVFNDLQSNLSTRVRPASFTSSRELCAAALPWPERFAYCLPEDTDYGLRVHGNADPQGALLPARLALASWSEPDYSQEDQRHEQPTALTATLTTWRLEPGATYARLRFEGAAPASERNFLSAPDVVQRTNFVARGTHQSWQVELASNSTVFFRVVRRPTPLIAASLS